MDDENKFIKFIIRKGNEINRDDVIYDEAEPVYVTDYKRLFIGDGITPGGVLASNKFLGFADFNLITNQSGVISAYKGDYVYDRTTNNLYALTGTIPSNILSYAKITRNFIADNITTTLTESSAFSVKKLSLDAQYLQDSSIGRGLEKYSTTEIRMADPSQELYFDLANKLAIRPNGISNEMLETIQGNHVKGNIGVTGNVEDIPIQDLANALAPLLANSSGQTLGVPIGTVIDYAGPTPPEGYLFCNGQTLSASEYPELYNSIKNYWGGTYPLFNLPDFRRRVSVGSGGTSTTNLGNALGSVGGSETVILEKDDVPSHIHTYQGFSEENGNYYIQKFENPTGNFTFREIPSGDGSINGLNVGPLGRPTNIIQPSVIVTKCIKAF